MNTLWSFFSKSNQAQHDQAKDAQSDNNNGFPVPNPTSSYWRSELHPIDSYCTSEELPPECDIAIIGAGMTGVSTAYHLSRLHDANPSAKKPSIVILDAREVCSGATGRNGGHSKVQAFTLQKVYKEHGLEAANDLAAFALAQQYHMKQVVDRENLDCEFEMRRSYDVYIDEEDAKQAGELYRTAMREGYPWARDLDLVGGEFVEQVTSIKGAKAAISMPTCSLWPYKFVTQLLSKLVDSNAVTLYTHTPVTSISTSSASSTTLHTPHGTLTTKKLIFATNAYTSSICPVYAQRIIPYKGTACHISPSHPISPHLSNTYNIYQPHPSSRPQRTDYLNPRPDSSIVLGGGKHLYAVDKESWYNSTDDSTLLPHVSTYFTSYMASNFLGWKHSAARITHLWTGIQGSTPDEFPYIGKVPAGATGEASGEATGKEEWYIAAGFNGGGMTFIFQCAEGLAKMVEGKRFEETGLLGLVDARRMGGGVSR